MTLSVPLADTHCHLNLPAFDADLDEVLDRARAAGIRHILVPGIDLSSSARAVALAQREPELFAAVGIHPHESASWNVETRRELEQLARSNKVVAIGEIGLDYYRDLAPHAVQQRAFSEQLQLAARLNLPVVIHQRESMADILAYLRTWLAELPRERSALPGVLHAFSGDRRAAEDACQMGFRLGIGGPVTFKNATSLQDVVAGLALTSILLETDAPYLAPHPLRGKRNEPAYIVHVAEAIAALLQTDPGEVKRQTSENADRVFVWREETGNAHLP